MLLNKKFFHKIFLSNLSFIFFLDILKIFIFNRIKILKIKVKLNVYNFDIHYKCIIIYDILQKYIFKCNNCLIGKYKYSIYIYRVQKIIKNNNRL